MIKIARNFMWSILSGYADLLLGKDERPLPEAEWNDHVATMREDGELHGDLPYIKLTLECLLAGPDEDLQNYRNGASYRWTTRQLRQIFEHAYHQLWPSDSLPLKAPDGICFVDADIAQWKQIKREQADSVAGLMDARRGT